MKKIISAIQLMATVALFSTAALADDDDWGGGGYGWDDGYGRPRCERQHRHHGWGGYPRQQINNYYPQPQENYYYPQPPAVYYQPQPQYYPPQPQYNRPRNYDDNRSHQGLAGGVIGDVIGYELGNGNPLAAGIGAAAGSFLGNGAAWQ